MRTASSWGSPVGRCRVRYVEGSCARAAASRGERTGPGKTDSTCTRRSASSSPAICDAKSSPALAAP